MDEDKGTLAWQRILELENIQNCQEPFWLYFLPLIVTASDFVWELNQVALDEIWSSGWDTSGTKFNKPKQLKELS